MFVRKKYIAALLLAVCLSSVRASPSGQEGGSSASVGKVAGEAVRRKEIVNHAISVFTLVGAEMALQKGDSEKALLTYMQVLENTRDPNVAERAMDMAIGLRAYEHAEMIYQRWLRLEKTPSPALRRITWMRDLVIGRYDKAAGDLGGVLDGASEEQRGRIFLLVAQLAAQNAELAKILWQPVNEGARRFDKMPEAIMADAILSALGDRDGDAVRALQRLARLDGEILPPTYAAMHFIGQRKPEVINRFFAEPQTEKLSEMWRELQVNALISSGKNDEAYALLQKLIAEQPKATLYIQAAYLSGSRKEPVKEMLNYLNNAYRLGTQEEQGRAAMVAAIRLFDEKDYAAAREWLGKIRAPEYTFDKLVMSALVDGEEGKWKSVQANVKRAQSLGAKQGYFFDGGDLLRVHILALGRNNNPHQVLRELNLLYRQGSKEPDNAARLGEILYQRALVYSDKLNRPQRAVTDLRRALALNGSYPHIQNALGYTLLNVPKSDLEEAFLLIQAAYEQLPQDAAINDSLGWAYFLKGDAEAALPYLQYAYSKVEDAEIAAHLGEALWKTGRREEARKILQKASGLGGNVRILRETLRRLGLPQPAAKKAGSLKNK